MSQSNEPSVTELANAAFEQAAKKVIERAIQTGTPVIVSENGEVKKIDPQTLIQSTKSK